MGRRALVDHFLARRSTDSELDDPALRDRLAAATNGWTPVMIEHLLDEALVNALRRGSMAMTYADIEHARITEMVGIGQPVRYTEGEQRLIATHEAGHAVTAWLAAPNRTLEVLTIIRRGDALGLLAHGDCEEVWTHSHYDLRALVQIAMGGWVAEELFFGQTSTGPAGDLASATRTAAQMVGAAGMTGSLISFAATPHDLVSAVLSDAQARAQLEAVLDDARTTVRRLLSRHRHLVEALRDALLERHELIGEEITDVLEAATLAQEQLLAREESDRTPRRRLAAAAARRGGGAAAGGLAFGACPRVIPSTASPASSPRTSSVDGSPSARRRAGSRPARRGSTGRSSWLRTPSASSCSARSSPVTSCACTWACTARGTSTGRSRRWCPAGSRRAAWARRGCAGPCGWARASGRSPGRRGVPARARRSGAGAAGVRRDRRRPARAVGVRGARPGGRGRGDRAARPGPGVDRRPRRGRAT